MIRPVLVKLFAAVAFFLLSGNAALAQCMAAETYTHDWAANPWPGSATLATSYPVNDGGAGGPTRTATFTFTGNTGFFAGIPNNGPMTPYSGTYYTGGFGAGTQSLIMGARFGNATRSITLTLTLDQPVPDVHFSLLDIDFTTGQFRDFVTITGTNTTTATNFTPTLTREATTSVYLGPPLTPNEAAGVGSSNSTSSRGNLYVDFTNPVNQISITYQNGGRFPPNNFGLQGLGTFHNFTFCPALLPNISVTKSVTVYDPLSLGLHAVPGNEVVYTITVANTGAIAADLNSLVIEDALPTSMAFYNGDFDDGGPGTTVFNFTPGSSGLTCCGGGTVQFSDSPVPPPVYGYVPAAGHDSNVHFLRIAPTGAMAATSSFQIQFRALLQ